MKKLSQEKQKQTDTTETKEFRKTNSSGEETKIGIGLVKRSLFIEKKSMLQN